MRVTSSHLALRFYESEGWTPELLRSCLKTGDVGRRGEEGWWYWALDHTQGSSFDVPKLMEHITEVHRWYRSPLRLNVQPYYKDGETDEEFIRDMNR